MKKEMKSFFLRMAVVLLVLGAICFVEAYGAGKLCAEMLLTPACAALAYAAYQGEKNLFRFCAAVAIGVMERAVAVKRPHGYKKPVFG